MTRYEDLLKMIDVDTDECIIWPYGKFTKGYAAVNTPGAGVRYGHRVAYMHVNGHLDSDVLLDHQCHTRECVNPKHLNPATGHENQWNRKGADSDSQSGVRGVIWDSSRSAWRAQTKRFGRKFTSGRYSDIRSAEDAVIKLRARVSAMTEQEILAHEGSTIQV